MIVSRRDRPFLWRVTTTNYYSFTYLSQDIVIDIDTDTDVEIDLRPETLNLRPETADLKP